MQMGMGRTLLTRGTCWGGDSKQGGVRKPGEKGSTDRGEQLLGRTETTGKGTKGEEVLRLQGGRGSAGEESGF